MLLSRQTPHAERVLGRVHDLLVARLLAPQMAAQLADHPLAVVEHELTNQRGPVAVDAPGAAFPQGPHAGADEIYFENGSRPR